MGGAAAVEQGTRLLGALARPARVVPLAFLAFLAVGTVLLMLPVSTTGPGGASFMDASFTAVSAGCVTGLAVVDTATFWSPFGQVVILVLIQIGGLGIMTLATLLGMLVSGRLSVKDRLTVRAETHAFDVDDVGHVITRIAASMLVAEGAVALLLALRYGLGYGFSPGQALWHGVFHSVSAFNNAGFALYSDNLVGFVADAWIVGPICAAIIVGGLGYPVLLELLRRSLRPTTWSAHTRITVYGSVVLLVGGTAMYLLVEGTNPRTLGPLDGWGRIVAAATASTVARTAGFNSIDYGAITPLALLGTIVLMFIGGGSAGTAGGVKVTTFFLLGHFLLAEIRGDDDITVGRRRIALLAIRQAVTVALLGMATVVVGTFALLALTGRPLGVVAFEATSAFATVGLSTGLTPSLSTPARIVVMLLMFVGRVGTVTVASAVALRQHKRRFHYPEERPIVG